jgi:hypothetical protein
VGQDSYVSQFIDYVGSFFESKHAPKAAPKQAPKPAHRPAKPRYSDPTEVPPNVLEGWLTAVGFNEMSTRRLMEVNPRLAMIAIEAKQFFDTDPANRIKDKSGRVIGHKTFQIQHNGGFRTVRDQSGPTGAGNSNASPSRFQSHHQWGQAFDFWVFDHINASGKQPARETPLPDTEANHVYYERIADKCVNTRNARAMRLTKDDMRITLNGSPDWGHIELPERFRNEWRRHPTTGTVYVDGQKIAKTGIDPELHPRPGPTYSLLKPKN